MSNLDFFGMFDYSSGDTDVYQYTSEEFSTMIKALTANGVAQNTDAFETTANGLNLTIKGGTCFIEGRFGLNENYTNIALEAEAGSLQRIDRLVLELDVINRKIELKILKGTAAATAAAPALTQTEYIYQLPLYQIKISGGSSTTLIDERQLIYSPTEAINKLNRILNGTDLVYAVYA